MLDPRCHYAIVQRVRIMSADASLTSRLSSRPLIAPAWHPIAFISIFVVLSVVGGDGCPGAPLVSHFAQIVGHLVWLNGRGISEAMKFQLAHAGHFSAVQDCYEWKKLSSRTDRPADQR